MSVNVINEFINLKEASLEFCDSKAGSNITYRQSGHDMKGVLLGTHEQRFFPRALVKSKTGKEYYIYIENLLSIDS